jgi:F-type H+-transporting ATPase subunit b
MEGLLPDFTFLIQLAIFFASFAVLQVFVFKPYVSLIRAREEKTTGLREIAAKNLQRAEKLKTDYEQLMKAERTKLTAWSDEQRRMIADEERKIVQAARNEVGKELQGLRDTIKAETDRARADLSSHIPEYSSSIATKLVGYQVKVPLSAVAREKTGEVEQVV